MAEADVELIQFPYSPYNEKARWALDLKQVPHRRRSLLPGPHAPVVLRLTGRTEVPVLRIDGQVIAGSAEIVAELDRRFPEPRLIPEDPEARERALEIQAWFDERVGPCVRRALFDVMLPFPGYLASMFSAGSPWPVRWAYRAAFPVVSMIMRSSMEVTPSKVEEALEVMREGLDFVVKHAGAEGDLVGERFGIADLTAASMLAPIADPPHPAMARPNPKPEPLARFFTEWARHPGVAWVHHTYRRHRPPSAELA